MPGSARKTAMEEFKLLLWQRGCAATLKQVKAKNEKAQAVGGAAGAQRTREQLVQPRLGELVAI
eukprot:6179271-Pleurochrysis_carterae.AAC.10